MAILDERPDGVFLIRLNDNGAFCGDTWHQSAEEARGQAEFEFERVGRWREIPAEASDAQAYVLRESRSGDIPER